MRTNLWYLVNCTYLVVVPCSRNSSTKYTDKTVEWTLLENEKDIKFKLGNYCIMILNRPIEIKPDLMRNLWEEACWRITVDGGTDRWFRFLKKYSILAKPPDAVSGDFDSILPRSLDRCKKQGIYVEETPDQMHTDFTKALEVVRRVCPVKLDSILVVLETGGRLDHIFSVISTLSKTSQPSIYVLSSNSLYWVLHQGTHVIHIPQYLVQQREWCGLLPVQPAFVSTTGLKWNLTNMKIEFGHLVSSSNTYEGDSKVIVQTNGTIIWIMGIGNEEEQVNGF